MRFILKRFEDLDIESILVGVINAIIVVFAGSFAKYLGFICFMSILIITSFATVELLKKKISDRISYLISYYVSALILILIKIYYLS